MLSNLSIRVRLALAFSILLGLLITVAALSLQRIERLTATTQEVVDYQARRVFLAQRANQHAQGAAIHLLSLLQISEREKRVPLYAAMDAEVAATDQVITALGHTMVTAEVQNDIERIQKLRARYGELFQETVELIEIEGSQAARVHFTSKTEVALNQLLGETLALANHQRDVMDAQASKLKQASINARLWVLSIGISTLLIGVYLSRIIGRSIVKPVREAVAVAETIASGDYRKVVPEGGRDEMGALLRALTIMRDSIASREDSILRMAYVDTLTGLPNRTRFLEILRALPGASAGALVILDIDRFSPINNALGHTVGDSLLREISARLELAIQTPNVVARLWGDEFALLLCQADKISAAQHVAQILSALRAPMIVDGQHLDIDASFGIALYPQDGADVTTLLRRADAAMHVAKRRQDKFAFGSERDDKPAIEQLSLIGEMRTALERGEFVVYYQPKLNLSQNKITAAEALIRWRHPEKGMIPPMRFIPFAEQTGFIREITPWLLRRVIEHAAQWYRTGLHVVASANLSTRDLLNHDLVADIQCLLKHFDLPADCLCLEITESALMDDPDLALKHLHELSALGLKLSIDDYGSGQASLGYVKMLPVNELKIDRVFVTDVDTMSRNAAIVRSTILLCRELGLSVVAEGAETTEELDWLKSNECELVQGYVVAKPMPEDEFRSWVGRFNQQA